MFENQANFIYLGIGSNLGDRKKNIEVAKYKLIEENIKILELSNYYESASWPDPKNPKFLNIVIKISTNLKPKQLLNTCKLIELELGRKKSVKNAPRICDIDIIDFKRKILKSTIKLPHPRMHKRNFVLIPLFELDKNWHHPKTNKSIEKLIFSLPNSDITTIKQI